MEKKRNHPVLSHPLAAMVLLMVYGFAMAFIANIAGIISDPVESCAIILVGVLLLVIHKAWFKPEFRGNASTAFLQQKPIVVCMLVFIGLDLLMHAIQYAICGFSGFSISVLLNALCAGLAEEAICRGLVISTMMRKYKDNGFYWPALFLPALLFGLSHLLLLSSHSVSGVVTTVISAALAGLFFAALYLRSGSVLPSVIIHSLHDLMAMMVADSSTVSDTIEMVLYLFLLALLLVLSIVLVKGHKDDILAVWKERWSGDETQAS